MGLLLAGAASAASPVILVLGDSLSAAYGIPQSAGWVALLQQRLADEGLPHRVVNASVSGETSTGGLTRLPALLDRHRPDLVLIELGGNDGLRGQPIARLKENLHSMIRLSREAGARPVLFEMRIPSNYGPAYTEAFFRSFSEVGEQAQVPVVPFFLAAIAEDEAWFQPDGIHPTEAAQVKMLDAVWPHLQPLLDPVRASAADFPP